MTRDVLQEDRREDRQGAVVQRMERVAHHIGVDKVRTGGPDTIALGGVGLGWGGRARGTALVVGWVVVVVVAVGGWMCGWCEWVWGWVCGWV